MTSGPRRALTVINAGPIRIFRMRAPATALLVSAVGFLGCGEEVRGQVYDPERVARCISARSGTLLSDPLAGRSDVRLSPALRERAAGEPRVGVGSVLPRPAAFAAFGGFDPTFVPPGVEISKTVPATFVFFPDTETAEAHEPDAHLRRGNALIVFKGDPPQEQIDLINDCL